MAHVISDAASFWCDNAATTLTNISGSVNNLSVDGGQNLLDDTGLSDTRHTFLPGLATGNMVSINGFVNSTTEGIFAPVLDGTSIQKTIYIGIGSGQYLTGEAYPESVQMGASVDALSTFSCTFRATNGLTRTSVAPS